MSERNRNHTTASYRDDNQMLRPETKTFATEPKATQSHLSQSRSKKRDSKSLPRKNKLISQTYLTSTASHKYRRQLRSNSTAQHLSDKNQSNFTFHPPQHQDSPCSNRYRTKTKQASSTPRVKILQTQLQTVSDKENHQQAKMILVQQQSISSKTEFQAIKSESGARPQTSLTQGPIPCKSLMKQIEASLNLTSVKNPHREFQPVLLSRTNLNHRLHQMSPPVKISTTEEAQAPAGDNIHHALDDEEVSEESHIGQTQSFVVPHTKKAYDSHFTNIQHSMSKQVIQSFRNQPHLGASADCSIILNSPPTPCLNQQASSVQTTEIGDISLAEIDEFRCAITQVKASTMIRYQNLRTNHKDQKYMNRSLLERLNLTHSAALHDVPKSNLKQGAPLLTQDPDDESPVRHLVLTSNDDLLTHQQEQQDDHFHNIQEHQETNNSQPSSITTIDDTDPPHQNHSQSHSLPTDPSQDDSNTKSQQHLFQTIQSLIYLQTITPDSIISSGKPCHIELPPSSSARHLLIYDLDETLVHCFDPQSSPNVKHLQPHFLVHIRPNLDSIDDCGASAECQAVVTASVNVRPFARECLKQSGTRYDVGIFTASNKEYADAIIDQVLDPTGELVKFRLYRQNCVLTQDGIYIKDLSVIQSHPLSQILLVDNSVHSFGLQLGNGIPLVSFFDDCYDQELVHLCSYVLSLANTPDQVQANSMTFNLKQLQADSIQKCIAEQLMQQQQQQQQIGMTGRLVGVEEQCIIEEEEEDGCDSLVYVQQHSQHQQDQEPRIPSTLSDEEGADDASSTETVKMDLIEYRGIKYQ